MPDGREVSDVAIREARSLFERGAYTHAHALLAPVLARRRLGRLRVRDLATLDLCYRVCDEHGSAAIDAVVATAARTAPDDPVWLRRRGWSRAHLGGPLAFSSWLDRRPPPRDDRTRIAYAVLRADEALAYRDFDEVARHLDEAAHLGAEPELLLPTRVIAAELDDDLDAALVHAESLASLLPLRTRAQLALAHVHASRGSLDGAVEVLERACTRTESVRTLEALATYEQQRRRIDRSMDWLERAATLVASAPDPVAEARLTRRRIHCALAREDVGAARALAATLSTSPADAPLDAKLVAALARDGRRVELALPYVRQDFLTCGPATLTSIANFHGLAIGHDAVVDAIWDAGTRVDRELAFATSHGLVARLFRVTFDAARALLDAGIPFTIATSYPNGAHLSAVVGYDSRLGTLLVRDPSTFVVVETPAEELLERYAACGPMGMAVAPEALRAALDAIELPDREAFSLRAEADRHIEEGRRVAAVACLDEAEKRATDPRTVAFVRWSRAFVTRDAVALYKTSKTLAALSPRDSWARYAALSYAHGFMPNEERLRAFVDAARETGDRAFASAALDDHLAGVGTWHYGAAALRAMMHADRGLDEQVLGALSRLALQRGERTRAFRLARFAATCAPQREPAADALRALASGPEQKAAAAALLASRARGRGLAFAWAVRPACRALVAIGRHDQAITLFAEAVARGGSQAHRATLAYLGIELGDTSYAERCAVELDARHHLALRAVLAARRGDHDEAIHHLRALQASGEDDGWALDAELRHLGDTIGLDASLARLAAVEDGHGDDDALRARALAWYARGDARAYLEAARALVVRKPHDAWALREVAIAAHHAGQPEEAERALAAAEIEEPRSASSARTSVIVRGVTSPATRARLAEALRHPVIHPALLADELADLSGDALASRLRDVLARLDREAAIEAALPTLRPYLDVLSVEERGALARTYGDPAHGSAAGCALRVDEHLAEGANDRAVACARARLAAHPHDPDAWLDLDAALCATGGASDVSTEALAALERASALAPNRPDIHRARLARLARSPRLGASSFVEAQAAAARLAPGDAGLRADLARYARESGEVEKAIGHLEHAVRVAPLALAPRDELAIVLTEEERYDDAIEVCLREPIHADARVALRGRAAWVEHARGQVDDAIASMTALVAASPSYAFGHSNLCDWHMRRGDSEALRAALDDFEQLARLRDAELRVCLQGRWAIGDAKGVRAVAARIARSGAGTYATVQSAIVKLAALDSGDQAADVLASCGAFLSPAQRAELESRVAIARGDAEGLVAALSATWTLCSEPTARAVAKLALIAGMTASMNEATARAIEDERTPVYVGAIHARLLVARGRRFEGRKRMVAGRLNDALTGAAAASFGALAELERRELLMILRMRVAETPMAFCFALESLIESGDVENALQFADGWQGVAGLDAPTLGRIAELRLGQGDLDGALEAYRAGHALGEATARFPHGAFVALAHLADEPDVAAAAVANKSTDPMGAVLGDAVRDVLAVRAAEGIERTPLARLARASVDEAVRAARRRYGIRVAFALLGRLAPPLVRFAKKPLWLPWAYPVRALVVELAACVSFFAFTNAHLVALAFSVRVLLRSALLVGMLFTSGEKEPVG